MNFCISFFIEAFNSEATTALPDINISKFLALYFFTICLTFCIAFTLSISLKNSLSIFSFDIVSSLNSSSLLFCTISFPSSSNEV